MDDPYPSYLLIAQVSSFSFSYFLINGLVLLLLLVGSALVSGSEAAFFSLTKDDLTDLNQKNPKKGRVISTLLATPKILLSTLLILNNVFNIGLITLTTYLTWSIFGTNVLGITAILIQTVGVTFAIVFFWRNCSQSLCESGKDTLCAKPRRSHLVFHEGVEAILGFFDSFQQHHRKKSTAKRILTLGR
jgi:CBS domain containing-hemolysin-like protein